jgi:hypothetical protein
MKWWMFYNSRSTVLDKLTVASQISSLPSVGLDISLSCLQGPATGHILTFWLKCTECRKPLGRYWRRWAVKCRFTVALDTCWQLSKSHIRRTSMLFEVLLFEGICSSPPRRHTVSQLQRSLGWYLDKIYCLLWEPNETQMQPTLWTKWQVTEC